MSNLWVTDVDEAAKLWLGWLSEPDHDGPLRTLPLHARAFRPGHRTSDSGSLGETDGILKLTADSVSGDVTWRLLDAAGKDPEQVAEVTAASDEPVELYAADGGPFILRCEPDADDEDPDEILVSCPYLIVVDAAREQMEPAFDALEVAMADGETLGESLRQAAWDKLVGTAERVAAHVLRPLNVRLLWDPAELWDGRDLPEDDALIARRYGSVDEEPTIRRLLVEAPRPADDIEALVEHWEDRLPDRDLSWWRLAGAAVPGVLRSRRAWGYLGILEGQDVGIVWEGLGGLTAGGLPVADQVDTTDADRALAVLGTAATDTDAAERFGELAGRRLGVCLAHAACRLIGMGDYFFPHARDLVDEDSDRVLTDLLDFSPADPVRDLLGLHRPDDGEFGDLGSDLDAQALIEGADDDTSESQRRWDHFDEHWGDLVAHYHAIWEVPDERTTAYDVLTGLVSPDRLETAQFLAPLPAPYGRHTLQHGNHDAEIASDGSVDDAASYGPGRDQGDDPDDRRTAIADLRADLRRIGITMHESARPAAEFATAAADPAGVSLTVRQERHYGYRRWTQGDAHWDGTLGDTPPGSGGQVADLKRGHTGWVVREFQIARRYPNTVIERLDATDPYADRLAVVDSNDLELPDNATPTDMVNGELSVAEALELRRWVLSRRRYPIVIEARTAASNDWKTLQHENLMASDGAASDVPRMFVHDLSGYGEPRDARQDQPRPSLGDYSEAAWGGPRAGGSHAFVDFDLDECFGDDDWVWEDDDEASDEENEARGNVRSVFRVTGAVALVEAVGHFDGFNAYDDAVFSYPPFHFTLGLWGANPGRPGQMAPFVDWLQRPPNDVADDQQLTNEIHEVMRREYQRAFGYFGVSASAPSEDPPVGFLSVSGLRNVTDGQRQVDMTVAWQGVGDTAADRQRALYQAYREWFRTWPWFARFADALRSSQDLRRLLFAYCADYLSERSEGRDTIVTELDSERAMVAYLRTFIRAGAYGAAAWGAQPDVDAMVAAAIAAAPQRRRNGLRRTTCRALAFNGAVDDLTECEGVRLGVTNTDDENDLGGLEGTGMPDADEFRAVRNRVLRSLVADGPPGDEDDEQDDVEDDQDDGGGED